MNTSLRSRLLPALLFIAGLFAFINADAQYCLPTYTTGTTDNDYIDGVVINTISNTATGGAITDIGYSDYTYLSTDLVAGTPYTVTLTNTPSWGETYNVWIDYNANSVFDADENLGQIALAAGETNSMTITLPLSAENGETRMRIRCIYPSTTPPAILDPCTSATYGEAEDYTVNISGGGAPSEGCTDPAALNYDPSADVDDGSCIYPYTITTCDYASLLSTEGSTLTLGDDEVSSAVPLGFSFSFYGTTYSDAYISSNGYLSFDAGLGSGCCTGAVLPNALYTNSIFFAQEDLDPNSGIDGTISYYTTGSPGSQIFVLSFVDVPHYPGPTGTFNVSVQVQLYEATGEIKIVTTEYNSDGGFSTMGLNLDGIIAQSVSGRNSQDWSAYNECISFIPYGGVVTACDATAGPAGEYADGITTTGATLHWNAVTSASQYVVSVWNLSTGEIKKKHVLSNSLTIGSALTSATSYAFRVKTVCYTDGLISPYSDWYYFTTGRMGNFEDMVKVYPNPSNGNFNLQLNGYENTQVQLIISNSTGQIVFNNNVNISENAFIENISLPDMAQGMYQLKVINGDNVVTNNIIIQ